MKLTPSLSFILKYAKGSFKTTTWHISMCCYKNYIKLVQIYRYQRSKLDIMSQNNCCFFNLTFLPPCLIASKIIVRHRINYRKVVH